MIDLSAFDQVPPKPRRRWYVGAVLRAYRICVNILWGIWALILVSIGVAFWLDIHRLRR